MPKSKPRRKPDPLTLRKIASAEGEARVELLAEFLQSDDACALIEQDPSTLRHGIEAYIETHLTDRAVAKLPKRHAGAYREARRRQLEGLARLKRQQEREAPLFKQLTPAWGTSDEDRGRIMVMLTKHTGLQPESFRNLTHAQLVKYVELAVESMEDLTTPARFDPGKIPDELVTLDQAAAMVSVSKTTLERAKRAGKLPAPDLSGGGGRANKWYWKKIKPALEKHWKPDLPENYPAWRVD